MWARTQSGADPASRLTEKKLRKIELAFSSNLDQRHPTTAKIFVLKNF